MKKKKQSFITKEIKRALTITVQTEEGGKERRKLYKELIISGTDLDNLPVIFLYYFFEFVESVYQLSLKREELKVLEATLDEDARLNITTKVTDSGILRYIQRDEQWRVLNKEKIELERNLGIMEGIVRAYQIKADIEGTFSRLNHSVLKDMGINQFLTANSETIKKNINEMLTNPKRKRS